jgi:hypothetical protein
MPGSPSLVGRKPGIKNNIKLVAREGLEGSNPSPGADFWFFIAILLVLVGFGGMQLLGDLTLSLTDLTFTLTGMTG